MPRIEWDFHGNISANVEKVFRYNTTVIEGKRCSILEEIGVSQLTSKELAKLLQSGEVFIGLENFLGEAQDIEHTNFDAPIDVHSEG